VDGDLARRHQPQRRRNDCIYRRTTSAGINDETCKLDALVTFLDEADGDTDLEPSFGDHMRWIPLALIDSEGVEHNGREPSDDLEPSLCAAPCVGLLH
jgi:hypothetical protein